MSVRTVSLRRAISIAVALVFPAVSPAATTRLGVELQVNSYTGGSQTTPSLAVAPTGSFVVVWNSFLQDGGTQGIFARRFDASGVALAVELRINSYTGGDQQFPSVAVEPDGDFVVAWDTPGLDGSGDGIAAQRFDSAGTPRGLEFVVNASTLGDQLYPRVAASANGFVVVWRAVDGDGDQSGVSGRRFDSNGNALGFEFQANTYTTGDQLGPSVAIDPTGRFAVAWQSNGQDGQDGGVFARGFASSGAALASEFQVNTLTEESQGNPSVAMASDGGFVVAWSRSYAYGSYSDVDARVFDATGSPLSPDLQINEPVAGGFQDTARVARRSSGAFVVTWRSFGQDGDQAGVFARELTRSGSLMTAELQVHSYTTSGQVMPAVSVAGDGDFVVAWVSGHDGSDLGVFAQRFATGIDVGSIDVDGDGDASPLTDGLLLLRYLFGFRGATLINGALGQGCTRCTASAIETFLAQLVP